MFLILAMGAAVGFVSGMFGIGGGFLMTPLLIFIGISPAVAVASVSSHMAASSFSGALSYWRRRAIDPALSMGAAHGRRHRNGAWRVDLRVAALCRPTRSHHRTLLCGAADHSRLLDASGRCSGDSANPQGSAAIGAPAAGSRMDPQPSAEDAVQALQDLSVGDPDRRHRPSDRLPGRDYGYRRQLPADSDHDLCSAGADLDRDRHVHGADPRHHDLRDDPARHHKPPRRCRFSPLCSWSEA